MAKRKENIDRDLRELIQRVTGFDEKDENFKLCVSFADSNFKYHRYLSPDSHKIHRAIEGLCEKFEVHSQKQKAVDLRELTALFLEQTGLDGKDTGKTDVHYALLSLLIGLAESPTLTDFQRKKKQVVEEVVDNFDWKSYLLDDEDVNIWSFASSDSEEEEESLRDSYEDDDSAEEDKEVRKREIIGRLDPLTAADLKDEPSRPMISVPSSQYVDEYAELGRLLVVEYWKGQGKEEETGGSHAASNLARDWNQYQSRINEFHTPKAQTVVTELQVIREALWMLSGVTELFIFRFSGHEFTLNQDVYVMHLTTESLESSLRPLMRKAAQVCALQSFVNDIVSQVCSSKPSDDDTCVPQTYQAFASSVSTFLSSFRSELCGKEKVVMKQEELVSLEKLTSDLQPWLAKVQAVHGVYISGIASAASLSENTNINNCFKASLLLNVLYQSVFESDLLSYTDIGAQSSVMLKMLIKSSEPLIQITSDWINNGQLNDPAGEFVMQRNKNVRSLDETFWEQAFVSNINPSTLEASLLDKSIQQSGGKDTSDKSTSISTITSSTKENTTTKDAGTDPRLHSADAYIKFGPRFLQPILGDAVLTGKSMEMLENLGRMGEVLHVGCGIYERPPSLFELFVKDLKAELRFLSDSKDNKQLPLTELESSSNRTHLSQDATITKQLNMRGEKDTLLNINFAALFPIPSAKSDEENKHNDAEIPADFTSDLSPLLRLCERCLYPHVRSRYQLVCAKLVHILKTEYNLMDCIHAMQRYYLMSSGEVMYDFYTPIFDKIQCREHWRNSSLLELYLHEAVTPRCPRDLSRLSVTVIPTSKHSDRSPISLTDCIQLKYNVPWPVDVVISGKCQELYNNIFTFLLQIKRAKYCLDQLRFEDVSRYQAVSPKFPTSELFADGTTEEQAMPRKTRIHKFQLLRFRLLYFVNSLHNYIMTRILHSTGLEFASQLEAASDLEQIISVHKDYVEAIHERCLLHRRVSFLRETVVKVLNLSLTFSVQWQQGVDFISGSQIEEMDVELSRCVHFLSAFLNNVIKRGSFPHLESLAFALVSSVHATIT